MTQAVVFFDDGKDVRGWGRLLRRGFRHCFVAIADPYGGWKVVDACRHQTFVDFSEIRDLIELLREPEGRRALPTEIVERSPASGRSLRPYTCVEVVKDVLGVRAWWVFTPWQLYNHLQWKDFKR